MAQKTIVTLVDDLTGEEAEDISTVEFALDGVTYEIDLNDENAKQLREVFGPYISAARRTGGRRTTGGRSRSSSSSSSSGQGVVGRSKEAMKAIREMPWYDPAAPPVVKASPHPLFGRAL
jgi:hypothetical protein